MALQFDFKSLGDTLEVLWPVPVKEPIDGGKVRESEFTAKFRVLPADEATELMNNPPADDPLAFLRAVLVGLDPKHGELTPELFTQLMGRPYVRSAVLQAYFRCANGASAKN